MTQDLTNSIHWIADEGKTFVRVIDDYNMGEELWLGHNDSIDNYQEMEQNN